MAEECGTCDFRKPIGDSILCRRFPPSSDGQGVRHSDCQPIMKAFDWCGEYQHGDAPQQKERREYSRSAAVLIALFTGIMTTLWLLAGFVKSLNN